MTLLSAGPGRSPRVSVVLPAFNGSKTIGNTLRSIATQDYRPLDLVVVDDGSVEPLGPLVQTALAESGLTVQVVRHPTNQGLSRTLNDGWSRAAGELILIIHQDIELLGSDWITRAVTILLERDDVQVVTCHYGIPAQGELTFAAKAFGFLRRQFHDAPSRTRETVTFTEFKCDLVRRSTLEQVGGFPTNFRIAGEDLLVSYKLRQRGGTILKAYDLQVVQRFSGAAASIRGNLWKEYRFGMAFAGVFIAVRGYAFQDLDTSAYSRSRSWHRASQPPIAAAELALLLGAVLDTWLLVLLVLLVAIRFASYVVRLWPDMRRTARALGPATLETLGAALLGLLTDPVYVAGLAVGFVRAARGAAV